MTKRTVSILAGLALAIAASVPTYAQDASVVVHVPFAFSVVKSTLPAGDYTLTQLSQNMWVVRNEGGKAITASARPDGTNPDPEVAKLVFTKYGEHYLLSRVWCDGLTSEISEPSPSRAIELQMTSNNQKPETLYVLAKSR
jgi:hypothetical protein